MVSKSTGEKIPWPYKEPIGIAKKQWKDLLKDSDIMSEEDIRLLKEMYKHECIRSPDLAERLHVSNYGLINIQVGNLGRRVAERLDIQIPGRGWRVLFWGDGKRFVCWSLRPELRDAIREKYFADDVHIPEEINENDAKNLREGAKTQIFVNRYERNPAAREDCIKHYGTKCVICGFDFDEKYGEVGKNVIHVHHLKPLHEIGETYTVDPIEDLRPVCPNCHVIIHRRNPPYSVDEVKAMIKENARVE